MSWSVEISPSNRATCRNCMQKILLGEIRIGKPKVSSWGNPFNHFYCSRCATDVIDDELVQLDNIMRKLVEFNKKNGDKYAKREIDIDG